MLSDSELRDTMGRKGRAHVVDNSSLDSMTDGYTELVESLYRNNKTARRPGVVSSSIATWAGSVLPSPTMKPTS